MDFSHWSSFTLPTVLKKLKLKGCERGDMETGNATQREKRDKGRGGETRKNNQRCRETAFGTAG